jgi:hypothetical protein
MMPRLPLSGPLGLSLAALLIAVVVVLATVPTLLVAAFGLGTSPKARPDDIIALIQDQAHESQNAQRRFIGRSPFHRPPFDPPIIIDQDENDNAEAASTQPIVDPCPNRYMGPTLVGFVGDEVWFNARTSDELILRIPVGQASEALEVVAIDMPWTARVSYEGCPYDLTLWDRAYENHFRSFGNTRLRGIQEERRGVSP